MGTTAPETNLHIHVLIKLSLKLQRYWPRLRPGKGGYTVSSVNLESYQH